MNPRAARPWRLLPPDHETGWLPYAWLVHLLFFVATPIARWRAGELGPGEAAATELALLVFLVSYFRGYWVKGRGLLVVAGVQMLIGAVFLRSNPGALTFFVYAASFVAQLEHGAEWGIGGVAALEIAVATAAGVPLARSGIAAGMCLVIGAATLHQTRVRRANQRLRRDREHAEHIATVSERERIARDLHDVLGHTLTLIVLKSQLASRLAPRDSGRAAREMAEVEEVSRAALRQVREAIRGYGATLAQEAAQTRAILDAAGIRSRVQVEPVELARAAEEALALAMREAVTNVVRHSGAESARVRVHTHGGECVLEVEDDGGVSRAPEGSGLRGMRERVAALHGSVDRASGAGGRGTRIEVRIPLVAP